MKPQWPTLQDRLNHPLKDELTALQQLKQVLPLWFIHILHAFLFQLR